jgi:hypothetical protein
MMKVKELIEILSRYDGEMGVIMEYTRNQDASDQDVLIDDVESVRYEEDNYINNDRWVTEKILILKNMI